MSDTRPNPNHTEKAPLFALGRRLGPIRAVYDVGSRDALDGIELAVGLGAQELHVFECNPPSVEVCRRNLAQKLPASIRGHLSDHAVSDRSGHVTFHPIDTKRTVTPHPDGNPGASSLFVADPAYPRERYVQTSITVPTTTLDDYCLAHAAPDILWLDLQGAEVMALNGAQSILDQVKLIHIEIACRPTYIGQALFWDVHNALKSRFKLAHFDVQRWPSVPALYRLLKWGPWSGNAIYVHRQFG